MKRPNVCFVFAIIVSLAAALPGQAATPGKASSSLSQVHDVLRSEASVEPAAVDRRGILRPEQDPERSIDHAWWQSGFLKVGQNWLPAETSWDDSVSPVLNEYRVQRAAAPKTPDGQLILANWCRSQKLPEQERAHLSQVLALGGPGIDPAPIFRRMGYRQVGENWVSPAELQGLLRQSRRQQENLRQWQPKLERIVRNWNGSPRHRKLAQNELDGISDSSAIPALQAASVVNPSIALAICERLKAIDKFESSQALATIAVASDWPSVREAATRNLKERRIDDFAPALLGGMRGLFSLPGSKSAPLEPRLYFREEADRYVAIDVQLVPLVQWEVVFISRSPVDVSLISSQAKRNQADLSRRVEDVDHLLQQQLEDENDRAEEYNRRVGATLSELTGQAPSSSPKYWWAWWNLYTGTEACVKKCEVRCRNVPLPVRQRMVVRAHSCLVAGTPLVTERGLVAVDQIQVGDRVLSKDIDSGEIAYKPVLHTTVRQPVAVRKFVVGGTPVVASAGHHFWVSGHGWTKTSELALEQPIHTATGMFRVESVNDESQPAPVYNLVVADYHTYFIGPSMILSHDVLQPAPTNTTVPGLEVD